MTISTIFVGLDGSAGAERAARWSASLAADLGARVVAAYVYEPLDHLDLVRPGTDFAGVAELLRERLENEWLEPFRSAGVDVEAHILEGSPTEALASAAARCHADLIVIGAIGLHHRRFRFGSTASDMAEATAIPVTIIKAAEEPAG